MKKPVWWVAIGVVVIALLVVINVMRSKQGNGTPVQFARVRVEDITSVVRAPGKIEPMTQVKVSADIMGKITRLLVKEGDQVKKGQLMLQLDDTQYRADWGQARAAFQSASERRRDAEAALKTVEANFGRQKAVFEKGLLSQAEWDQAQRTHDAARVLVQTTREEEAQAQAGLDGAADRLHKTRFEAPFNGVVSALNVEQGEIVITGTMNNPGTEILTVSDASRMLVRADVDETDVVDMRPGQKAKITVDAIPDTSFIGTVTEIGNTAKRSITSTAEGQTNFEVKVVFDDNVPQVRPGMTADVEISTATHTQAQSVPIQAVVVRTDRELERATHKHPKEPTPKKGDAIAADEDTVGRKAKELTGVFVVHQGVATFVPVRTGIASETMIEVFGNVKQGDTIVAGPYKALRDLKPESKVKAEAAAKRGKKA